MVTPLVSYGYPFGILWLPLWYLQAFLISNIYLFYHQTTLYLSEYGDIDMLFIAL